MIITEGSTVLIYVDDRRKYVVRLTPGKRLDTDKGYIEHVSIIGKEYGSEVELSSGIKAFVFEPLPLDLYRGMERPSQVIYPKDASYIVYSLGLRNGSTVIEAGTGSGTLTIAMAWLVGDSGKVYSYDLREDMQRAAMKNLELMGLTGRVKLVTGDVRTASKPSNVDAVFLDLPDPWNVIESVTSYLKASGILGVFVPTTNQIEKTYFVLKTNGYKDIHVEELIIRDYQVKENAVRPKNIGVMHTGYIIRGRRVIRDKKDSGG